VPLWFRNADRRWPFLWEDSSQPPARWHGPGEGPAQYLADTPDGAWAEFLRHEEIIDPADVSGVRRHLWAIELPGNEPVPEAPGLLPAVLRLRGGLRTPDDLYAVGELTLDAFRIAQALESAGGVLSTGELRKAAGFPIGKAQRAAYLKAVEELDTRLLLAKVFSADDNDMHHALVRVRYPEQVAAAERLTREAALAQVLETYLPHAVYAAPAALAKHLRIPEAELRAGLERLVAAHRAATVAFTGEKGAAYVWADEHDSPT